jgi:hypothetical protein
MLHAAARVRPADEERELAANMLAAFANEERFPEHRERSMQALWRRRDDRLDLTIREHASAHGAVRAAYMGLAALELPLEGEHGQLRRWEGPEFDPEHCDSIPLGERLARMSDPP